MKYQIGKPGRMIVAKSDDHDELIRNRFLKSVLILTEKPVSRQCLLSFSTLLKIMVTLLLYINCSSLKFP
jgi:hypothetical protein